MRRLLFKRGEMRGILSVILRSSFFFAKSWGKLSVEADPLQVRIAATG